MDFSTLTEADYDAGSKEITPAQILTIKSNRGWVVNVKADATTWTGPWLKPAGDLEWKSTSTHGKVTATSTTYTGVTTIDAQVAAGNPGNNITVQTHFKILLSYENDLPGNYTLNITYLTPLHFWAS